MPKIQHTTILIPIEHMQNFKIRLDAGSKNKEWNWIDIATGATLLKEIPYIVTINIQEYKEPL